MEQDKKKKEDENRDKELKEIFRKADNNKGLQLGIPLDEDEDKLETNQDTTQADVQDPDESHRLYYAIRRLLMENLPQGKENLKIRQPIYDEKNLFINRGAEINDQGLRGSDGRQAYISHLKEALEVVKQWIKEGAISWDIYIAFREKNIEKGYRDRKE